MANKILKTLGTLVLGVGLNFNLYGQSTDKEIPCLSSKEVEFIASEIPKHFKQVDGGTYLIEYILESKNGHGLGGQLSVYISSNHKSILSIFDRTNIDSKKWYNVSNWDSKDKGCANWGIYLNTKPAKKLSKTKRQKKFNECIYKIKEIIKEKNDK